MRRRRQQPVVPDELVERIEQALVTVEARRVALRDVIRADAPLLARRAAHADLRVALRAADRLLREATALARQHSRPEWSHWRGRLSQLDTVRQIHLFAEADDPGVLRVGSVRAVDTGMSGPAIGDLLHGTSRPPGTPAGYGLDLEAMLTSPSALTAPAAGPETPEDPDAAVLDLPTAPAVSPTEAA